MRGCHALHPMTLTFTVPMEPVAKGRPRFSTRGGFARAYTPKKTLDAEAIVAAYGRQHRKHLGEHHFSGPVTLSVVFFMPIPKSAPKKQREILKMGAPHVKKPDGENLGKLVADALNGILYEDDSQLYVMRFEKTYAVEPRIEITLEYHE